jgi:hypothetical protein
MGESKSPEEQSLRSHRTWRDFVDPSLGNRVMGTLSSSTVGIRLVLSPYHKAENIPTNDGNVRRSSYGLHLRYGNSPIAVPLVHPTKA